MPLKTPKKQISQVPPPSITSNVDTPLNTNLPQSQNQNPTQFAPPPQNVQNPVQEAVHQHRI
jgi:hypothetical protein